MNKLTNENYEISRSALKDAIEHLVGVGQKFSAIKLLRTATGWGLAESKAYIESDMRDEFREGDKVVLGGGETATIQATMQANGKTFYWLIESDGTPCTYGTDDIKGLAA